MSAQEKSLQTFLVDELNRIMPNERVYFVDQLAGLMYEAFPYVHIYDWSVDKPHAGVVKIQAFFKDLTLWASVTEKDTTLKFEPTEPFSFPGLPDEMLETVTFDNDDWASFVGWFSYAAVILEESHTTTFGIVKNVRALQFTCQKTGKENPDFWAEAPVEINARQNVLRIASNPKNLFPWLHLPLDVNGGHPFNLTVNLKHNLSWIDACLGMKWIVLTPPTIKKTVPYKGLMIDPAVADLATMDFASSTHNAIRNLNAAVKKTSLGLEKASSLMALSLQQFQVEFVRALQQLDSK